MKIINSWLEKMTPPSSEKFFMMLREQAAWASEVALMLLGGVRDKTLGTSEFTARIHLQERKVDEMMDKVMHSVRQTMIHPVDPDDLREMAYCIDSTVDTIDHFAWRMEAYRLAPTPAMDQMISVIHEMTTELVAIFDALIKKEYVLVQERYRRLRDLEEGIDRMYHDAVKKIHGGGERAYTVEDEVLAMLERCSDQCMHAGRSVVVMLERNS